MMLTSTTASELTLFGVMSNDVDLLILTLPIPSPLAVALVPSTTVTENGLPRIFPRKGTDQNSDFRLITGYHVTNNQSTN